MELLWRLIYCLLIGGFVWLLHKDIDHYPTPLAKSENPKREIKEALMLWGVAVIVPILRMFIITPWLNTAVLDRTLRELIYVPLLTLPYLLLPLFIVLKLNKWKFDDLGLGWQIRSPGIAIAAILFGLASGIVAYVTNQAVIGIEVIPAGTLILLLYNNDFLEEFYHRGVIQAKLERALGQKIAIFIGGILFGMTHIVFDFTELMVSQGFAFVIFAFLLQVLSGWLLGIVYMKTRSLWPGVVCHYLANWLPSILVGVFG